MVFPFAIGILAWIDYAIKTQWIPSPMDWGIFGLILGGACFLIGFRIYLYPDDMEWNRRMDKLMEEIKRK